MGMSTGGGGGPKSDINVTPYIDILLVLLIIFMVITPFTPKGIFVQVPEKLEQDVPQEILDKLKGIVVDVKEGGTIVEVNRDNVGWGGLQAKLQEIYAGRADKSIFVKGDKDVFYLYIVQAIDAAKGAGVEQISLMTELED
ncbi:MAG: biopolymer transporter ExbD [Acidobacteria bacterium]|nr:biopolymer transporter ExbD [Acidobacteriota bacterium]